MRHIAVLGFLFFSAFALLPAPARADDPDTEIARRHFGKGSELYKKGDYAGALKEFQSARVIKPAPGFDFNIARCLDRLERWNDAIVAYERFVATATNPAEKNEAKERVRILRARVAAGADNETLAKQ